MAVTGSIQEKNGRYYIVLNLKTDDGKKKQKWESTKLPIRGNKKNAQIILQERLAELNRYDVPYSDITVSEYFKSWLKSTKDLVRPNTYRTYYGNMNNHIIPYFEKRKIKLQDLKPYQIEDYYKFIAGERNQNDEVLSPTTIKHHHQNISKALNDAQRKGLISFNPAASARTPRGSKYNAQFLDAQELKELIRLFKNSEIEIPVTLCATFGFRRSEVLGLKWENVNLKKKTITVCETLQQNTGGEYTDKPKTESGYRTLVIPDDICKMLEEHKKLQNDMARIMGRYYFKSDYVCTMKDGTVIKPNYLSKKFHAMIQKSSLPKIRLHDLRHSVASNLVSLGAQNGISIVDIQRWMGHANASTTLNLYSHAAKTSEKRIADTMQEVISENHES